jgi:ABC-type transporter Mla MlaB component
LKSPPGRTRRQPILAQECPPEDNLLKLSSLGQLYAGELLEQQPVQRRDIQPRQVDHSTVSAPDTADLALLRHRQSQALRQGVVDAIAACACVDQGLDALSGEIGLLARRGPGLHADVDKQRRPQLN